MLTFFKKWSIFLKVFTLQWCPPSKVSTLYAIYRFVLAAVLVGAYATLVIWKLIESQFQIFIYLTNLSYLLLVLHFAIEAFLVTKRWVTEKTATNPLLVYHKNASLAFIYKVSWVLQSMVFSSSLIVSIMYGFFVHPIWIQRGFLQDLTMRHAYLFGHIINSLICIVDIFISNRPWKFVHFIWPLIFGIGYVILTLFCWKMGVETIYDKILDWHHEPCKAIATISILIISLPLIHLFWMGLAKLRRQIYQKIQEKKTHPTS